VWWIEIYIVAVIVGEVEGKGRRREGEEGWREMLEYFNRLYWIECGRKKIPYIAL